MLTMGLGLLIVGCLLLAYAVFWLWFDSGQVLRDLEEQVAQADLFVQGTISATTDSIGMKKAEEFKQDYLLLQQKQISWGEVFHTILDVPEGLVVDSIIQSDFTVMVDGRASNMAIANEYLTKLQDSGLFKEPQVKFEQISSVSVALPPADSPTPSPSPADPTLGEPSSTPQVETPTPPARALLMPTPIPRPTNTFTITPSSTSTVAPAPKFDFALVARTSTRIEDQRTSHIRARILDENGNPIRGVAFRIESEGVPAWSAEKSNETQQDGMVEFAVTKGVFTVRPLVEGRVQAALGLVTGRSGVPGKQEWELVWRKTQASNSSSGSPTETPTITQTPSPTTPPRWAGRNIARLGSATVSRGQDTAHHAIDGDTETIWQSGGFPIQEIVITLNDLYRKSEIDGLELVVAQSSVGRTTHQIWVEDEAGDIHAHTVELTAITRDRQTLIVRWDPRKLGDGEAIRRVFVRTVSGPSWVGWREIGIFEKLPPPRSTMTPTRTSTATSTATMCPVTVCTATPTLTLPTTTAPTATKAPTATTAPTNTTAPTATTAPTITATPTVTPTFTAIAVGQNIATRATASALVGSDSARQAIDGDVETAWQSGVSGVQEIVIDLDNSYRLDAVALVASQASPGLTSHEVWAQQAGGPLALVATVTGQTVDRQVLAVHFDPAITTDRLVVRTIRSAGNVAWREIRVFEQLPPPLSTSTPTRTLTPAPSPTPTYIAPGLNVAPLGSASASSGMESAPLAIDNDPETAWQTNVPPSQTITIDLDDFYTIEAIALVVAQSGAASTTHQVFIYQEEASGVAIHTLEGETMDRQTLAILLDPAVDTNRITVKTIDAPGLVGWREIRIFEKLPPTSVPSDNSGNAPQSQPLSQAKRRVGQPHEFPGVSGIVADLLRLIAGHPSEARAAPAAQIPVDASTPLGLRFKLILEVEPGVGYLSK